MRVKIQTTAVYELREGFSVTFLSNTQNDYVTLTILDVDPESVMFTLGGGVQKLPLDTFISFYGDHLEPEVQTKTETTE